MAGDDCDFDDIENKSENRTDIFESPRDHEEEII